MAQLAGAPGAVPAAGTAGAGLAPAAGAPTPTGTGTAGAEAPVGPVAGAPVAGDPAAPPVPGTDTVGEPVPPAAGEPAAPPAAGAEAPPAAPPPTGESCLQPGGGDYLATGPYGVGMMDVTIGAQGAYTIFYPDPLDANCAHPIVAWGNGTGVTGSGT